MLNFVNAIIAFLGYLFLDELITTDFIVATILIVLNVFVYNIQTKKQRFVLHS